MTLGLYIHIPFCKQKCLYCDFPSYANLENLYDAYIDALCREIRVRSGNLGRCLVDSVYIGGGTPTILPSELLEKLLACLHKSFAMTPACEISMEANPGTIDRDKLLRLYHLGVNRLSLGVQAFNDRLLAELGRIHTAKEALAGICLAQQAGFENINIDLMYGLPGQSLKDWQQTLTTAVGLGIQHISSYGLKLEDGTPFATKYADKLLNLPDEILEEAMYDHMVDFLPLHRYKRYEISNYSLTDRECRHNLKYWRYEPYAGMGAGACSFLQNRRFTNTSDVLGYIKSVQADKSPVVFSETLEKEVAVAEYIFLGLRTVAGIDFALFHKYFGVEVLSIYEVVIKDLMRKKLIVVNEEGVRLSSLGMKYGNLVFASFLP